MENFRTPNFPLVAEVLAWLVKRYDPNTDMPVDIDTPQDRVIFIKSVASFMNSRAHIKLNMKKLYQADGYAVKELLKVTSVLYNAVKTSAPDVSNQSGDDGDASVAFNIASKVQDIKDARQLASEITTKGASLYDLLSREVDLREARTNVISRQLEINEVEKSLQQSIKAVEAEIKKTQQAIENIASDEANLEAKIEKKKAELERNQKRLETLQSVRPAYMDEYEKLEEELQLCYDDYMLKFRNQAYLENILDEYQRAQLDENESLDVQMKLVSDNMQDQKQKVRAGESDESFQGLMDNAGDESDGDDMDELNLDQRGLQRPLHARQRPTAGMGMSQTDAVAGGRRPVIKGSMGVDDIELDDDDTEDESGSSVDIDDEDSEDADVNDTNMRGGDPHARQQQLRSRPSRGRPQPDMADDDDDEDF